MSSMRGMPPHSEDREKKPNAARIYDYLLGGSYNTEADRWAAEQLLKSSPTIRSVALTNRAFLRRAVTFLVRQGIDQFLDIGSGIPTAGNVHEVAHQYNPQARVVYADIDPMAVALSIDILQDTPHATAIDGDLTEPDLILTHSETRRVLDFSRPIALLLVSMLHFVTSDRAAYQAVAHLRGTLPAGSYLVITHGTFENADAEQLQKATELYKRSANPLRVRTRAEIAAFFDTWQLVDPGLVWIPEWHPDGSEDFFRDTPEQSGILAGAARQADVSTPASSDV